MEVSLDAAEPTRTMGWWRWPRSSARRSASSGWMCSTATGATACPGLRPTAGYPNDAKRFRTAIETRPPRESSAIRRSGGGSSEIKETPARI